MAVGGASFQDSGNGDGCVPSRVSGSKRPAGKASAGRAGRGDSNSKARSGYQDVESFGHPALARRSEACRRFLRRFDAAGGI